ncbi:amidohydrolase family protein [Streptomyces sp. NPDC091294]|uniref:amidohydrolase family protein n=1 Tax=Streptomyces sp. NPDC091294 TaxID=3365992 RepID=UPI00382925B0
MEIVDTHCHIISADTERYPRKPLGGKQAPIGGKQSAWTHGRPLTAEELVERMDEAGVGQATLVQATTAYGYDNSYVLDTVKLRPGRFVAVGTFDATQEDSAERLRGAVDAGLSGVRLFTTDGSPTSEQGMWFADEAADAFWTAAAATRLPVCLQLRLGADTAAALDRLLHRHPDAQVLLDHCGYPDVRTSPAAAAAQLTPLAAHPGLHLKLTHRTLEGLRDIGDRAAEFVSPVLDAFSAQRIAWGSNCPAAEQPLPELITLATDVLGALTPREREDIFKNTALRLYPALTRR